MRPVLSSRLVTVLVALQVALHLATIAVTPYELHRDELLYLAMGDHLQLWRMDFPPFIALLGNVARFLLGDTLVAVRVFPALASGAIVLLAAIIARDLGGGRWAQTIAGVAVIGSPLFMRSGALFQPVVFDQLWWTIALWALVRLGEGEEDRWWLVLGGAMGMGLLTKFSILFLALPTAVAILATPLRRALRGRWPWVAVATALVVGLPSLVGQLRLGFPVRDQLGDLASTQLARVTMPGFFAEQLMFNAGASMVAIVGVVALVADRRFRAAMPATLAALRAVLLLAGMHGKPYYAGPIYPLLFAAGGAWLEALPSRRWAGAVRAVVVVTMAVIGAVLLPLGLPILAPPRMERYARATIGTEATRTNVGEVERIPQDYADMLNWKEQAQTVAGVYHALPAEERLDAVILGGNYGEAGALDF